MLDQITDLNSMLKDPSLLETRAYVNGAWISGDEGTFEVTNPARGDVVAEVTDLSRAQVTEAIAGAEAAQKDWATWTGKERAAVLRRWFELMMEHQDDLGTILTAEQGKPAGRGQGRDCLWRVFCRILCRGSQAHLRRDDSGASARQADHSSETAHWGGGVHHTMELSERHDHPQGSACIGGGVRLCRAPG